jgi:hypothetical protein
VLLGRFFAPVGSVARSGAAIALALDELLYVCRDVGDEKTHRQVRECDSKSDRCSDDNQSNDDRRHQDLTRFRSKFRAAQP